ncbi:MAG: PIN domain-containing protein [Defluviitaleaceae bacterium]|nr:PIN domain-containing protein [Defluviitaleaceae bacterium]
MRKPKIYLDTSVISHLYADDTPEKMNDTLLFWEELKASRYQVVISNITIAEITKCNEPKRTLLLQRLDEIEHEIFEENEEAIALSENYLSYGVLKSKSMDDLRHISVASVTDCKYIASWNFRHFVNVTTIAKVQSANKLYGYNDIIIVPPTMLTGGDEDE